jgi:hypothetical protein
MARFPIVVISVTMLAAAVPTPGGADHINAKITSGTIVVVPASSLSGSFSIEGNAGFSFDAGFDSGHSEGLCRPCQDGDTIALTTTIAPAYFGTARYRGKSYAFNFDVGGGWFAVAAPSFTLPPGGGTTAEFQTPFTVEDETFLFLQDADGTGHNLRLSGSGTATARYDVVYDPDSDTYFYTFVSMQLDFSKH